ncbi:hypothetical protein L208DRAFT_1418033 [Tricholoma matsutake]|nr:hypothetical protein L208DRAFT_1418033 [Tricholoma matsutake 945]
MEIRLEISRFSDLSIHWHNTITKARSECISAVVNGQLVLRQARLRVDAASLDSGASLVGFFELWAQGKQTQLQSSDDSRTEVLPVINHISCKYL